MTAEASIPERPPLTPPDCNLRDFPRMMIDIPRLRASAFDALIDSEAWRAGLNLWLSSWHKLPAGSLEDDDGALAKAAGLGRDLKAWAKVRAGALRGWTKCADGRLYHPVVSEMALEAWLEKLGQALSSGAGNARRWGGSFDPGPVEAEIDRAVAMLSALNPRSKALSRFIRKRFRGGPVDVPSGSQEKGTEEETGRNPGEAEASSSSDVRQAFETWNALALRLGLPRARNLDDARKKAIRTRLREGGLAAWTRALQAIEQSPHCRGDNDRGWRADLDFVCQARSFRRLVEGSYAGTGPDAGAPVQRPPWPGPAEIRAAVAAAQSEAFALSWLDACAWRPEPPAILTSSPLVAERLRQAVGSVLETAGVAIVLRPA
jgi:hypothetical protein